MSPNDDDMTQAPISVAEWNALKNLIKTIKAEKEKLRETKDLYDRLDYRYAGLSESYHKLKKENEKLHEELAYYQQQPAAPGEPPTPTPPARLPTYDYSRFCCRCGIYHQLDETCPNRGENAKGNADEQEDVSREGRKEEHGH